MKVQLEQDIKALNTVIKLLEGMRNQKSKQLYWLIREPKLQVIKISGRSGRICEEECHLSRECANHTTAGDFRSEDGMTPDLIQRDGQWLCTKEDTERNYGMADGMWMNEKI